VYIDSPAALTFGPQMVAAIRQSCGGTRGGGEATASGRRDEVDLQLDVHLCADRPERFVSALADAGATRLIFQWEAMDGDLSRAAALCQHIRNAGMIPGVSINPATPVEDIFPLLSFGKRQPEDDNDDDHHRLLVGLVDILAVEPGFGGQSFQPSCLAKIAALASWRTRHMMMKASTENAALAFDIMVDGGINAETAASAVECGANVMVAGTYLFQSSSGGGIGAAARALLHAAAATTTTTT
jgi:ribulose-phosphate 3-epimerase